MIHTASLIHDDVIDDSGMRRGTHNVSHEQVGRIFFIKKSVIFQ
ncbi:hypothetical protein HU200_026345 [Digitaria exilis]|uniref:Uncharacterized protein n=1 Tax=Digitaria exilis TaxID=1010633 RepID=A0A835EX96_9POAL|nr:hypothetical protein HU200_026345 [Digitaria exilis]